MEDVVIITRDLSGDRCSHHIKWSDAYNYIREKELEELAEEILMITVDGMCVYSSLYSTVLEWETVLNFFS